MLISQLVLAQKEVYFYHEPNGDGVYFSGTMKYYPNVKGGLEFRVIISDINIEAIRFNGQKYDTRYFESPNKGDIKGTIYFSGRASHGQYDYRQTWFNNCGITIELSKNTTTANMLQDNGSAYFSEAITDNYFENKTAFEASVKSDVHGGGANWVKYWKDYGDISYLKADRCINLHVQGTNNTTVFDFIKNQIVKKQQEEEFHNLRLELTDKSREGRTQQEYEDALKMIESALIKYKNENYEPELVKFKSDILAQIEKLKNSENKSNSTNTSQRNISDNSNNKVEPKKEKKKTIIRYSPEELARINAQIAYHNNVSNYQAKGLDYNSAHRMAQNDSKIEAMDKLGKEISKQLGNMVYNILEERDRRIEERENKHYTHVEYVKNYIEAIKRNNQIFLKEIKKMPIFEYDSDNIDDLKIEILYLINTLGNFQFNEGQVIVEKEILDAYFEGDILKIEYKEKCITSSMEYVYLMNSKRDSPILYDLHTISEMDFENDKINYFYKIKWTNGINIPITNNLINSKEFYQELNKINNNVYHKPYFFGIHNYISSSEINRKMDKLKNLIKDEIEDIILTELKLYIDKKDFKKALELSDKAQEQRGYLSIKNRIARLKIYHDSKDWLTAKKEYEAIVSLRPDNETLRDLAPFIINIEKEFSKAKAEEEKRIAAAKRKEEERFYEIKKRLPNEIEPQIKQMIEISRNIENGKPYIYTGPNLTSSPNEKSIIVFWDDQYIIFTLPSLDVLMNLNKDNISYSRYGVSDKEYDVSIEQKPYYGGNKKTIKFKKMQSQSNTYVGGFGDEIFRPLYAFEKYWEQEMLLCYYYYFNTKHADYGSFIQELDFDKDIYNPYYRTGKLNKGVDYSIVTNTELLNQLKELRYINRLEKDYSKPVGASISLNMNDNFNMLLPFKQFKMEQIEIKSYIKNGVKSQDKYYHYYYRPKAGTIKTVYSIASFPSNKTFTKIENSLTLNPKDFKVSKEDFDYIYNFQEGFFTHSDFKLPYDIFINLFK